MSENNDVGPIKLGRLPRFVYEYACDSTSQSHRGGHSPCEKDNDDSSSSRPLRGGHSPCENPSNESDYEKQFNDALQYFMSRCQHHIHRAVIDPKTKQEKRIVPNACAKKKNKKECKHEAPWTNRVSPQWMNKPLLVCKGIAKKFKLRTCGFRNWLGQTLGLRNDEAKMGVCLAYA